MPKFVFVYHQPAGYVPRTDSDAVAAWQGFFEQIGESIVEPGQPVFERASVGEIGAKTQLGGYSIVTAADLEGALTLAQACPSITVGGGVEVGLLAEVPPDLAASMPKERASRA